MWLLGFFLYATHEHDFFEGQVADRAAPICARAAERMEQDPPLPDEPTPEDRAREVEELTVIYADALEELRRLKQPGRDEAYDKWLSAWQQFVDLGPRFADALRTGDPEIYEPVGNEGDDPARVMNSIARDNGMDTCVF